MRRPAACLPARRDPPRELPPAFPTHRTARAVAPVKAAGAMSYRPPLTSVRQLTTECNLTS